MPDNQSTPKTEPTEAVSDRAREALSRYYREGGADRLFVGRIMSGDFDSDLHMQMLARFERETLARASQAAGVEAERVVAGILAGCVHDHDGLAREIVAALATPAASSTAEECPDCGDLPMLGDHTLDCTTRTTAEARAEGASQATPPVLSGERWIERWCGSGMLRGSSIWTADALGCYKTMIEHIGGDEETHACARRIVSAHNAALATQPAPVGGADAGYKEAWQEIADLLDIPAQAVSPREVHETQVMPTLRKALANPAPASQGEEGEGVA